MTHVTTNRDVSFTRAPKMRLTARGKRVVMGLILAPVLAIIFGIGMILNADGLGSAANASETHGEDVDSNNLSMFEYITVSHGESMWDIALVVAPESDPRDVIVDLKRFNALQSSTVLPGQSLAIPPQYVVQSNS